jgi:hypothetical protein
MRASLKKEVGLETFSGDIAFRKVCWNHSSCKKFINKDRYVFHQKVDGFLYCLDTVTGKIRYSTGNSFHEIEEECKK